MTFTIKTIFAAALVALLALPSAGFAARSGDTPAAQFIQSLGNKALTSLTAKDLPVDAHELVAMCAPRPVFISVGSHTLDGNGWIDAKGNFLSGVHAGPVYELLGKKGLGTTEFPKQETALVDSEVAFRQHAGGHTTGPNWPTFLKWADRYIGSPAAPAPGKE